MRKRLLAAAALVLCVMALGSCGNTLQDKPIGQAPLEAVIVKSHYLVYWLGLRFRGMQITSVTIDPGGASTIRYGDCIVGGQYTCVAPITIVSSPDNSFVPGAVGAGRTLAVRGATARVAKAGATLTIPTGGVVVSVYARTASLARASAATMAPMNEVGLPGSLLPPALADTGIEKVPLPSEVPAGVSIPRPRAQ
jgi:hypothetical protein